MPRSIAPSVAQQLQDLKSLLDDLGRLRERRDPAAILVARHLKREIDAFVDARDAQFMQANRRTSAKVRSVASGKYPLTV